MSISAALSCEFCTCANNHKALAHPHEMHVSLKMEALDV